MTDYNNAYYPLNTIAYTVEGEQVGTAIIDIWGIYNDSDPANAFRRGKPLDDSIYIWSIGAGSTAGTNACISVAVNSSLSVEMKTDNAIEPAKVAVCAYNYGYDGQAGNNDRGFRVDPKTRLAYDITDTVSDYGGWQKSCILCDINPLKWCVYPQIYIYTFPAGSGTFKTLDNMVSYINADSGNRKVSIIRPHLYRGDGTRTADPKIWDDNGSQIAEYPSVGLLKDRPICDNLASTVGAYIRGHNTGNPDDVHDEYDISKVYNPFNQALTTFWYRNSSARLETNERQMDIGYALQMSKTNIISGYANVPNNGKCTAIWAHINTNIQDFSDVKYQWRNIIYDTASQRELDPGFDVSSLSSGAIRFAAVMEILDKKNYATMGEAYKAAVLHELAYWGFWIAETEAKAQTDPLGTTTTGEGIYLPEKIGGVTTGYYFTGDDIKDVPYADATTANVFKYTPLPTSDTGDFSTIINRGTIGAGVKYYSLTEAQMNALTTWLNTTYTPTDETQLIQDFKGVNPADYITTVMYYPFDVPIPSAGTDETLKVGKIDATGVTGRVLEYTYGNLYDFGYYDIPEHGNFIDYMRKISVFIPFCGTVDLDPLVWTGKRLSIKMAIDFPTGICTAYLYRDTGVFDTISGAVGVPLPLSALANGDYQVSIMNQMAQKNQATIGGITRAGVGLSSLAGGVLDMKSAGSATAGGVASIVGGAVSAAGGIAQSVVGLPNLEYNLEHTQPAISQVSGGSPFINCGADFRVKVLICTPVLAAGYSADAYGKSTGYATCKQGVLSAVSKGYTECAGADLSGINATATEKAMIFNALKSGAIV